MKTIERPAIDIAACRSLLETQSLGSFPEYDELMASGADDDEIAAFLTGLFGPLDDDVSPEGTSSGFGELDQIVGGLQAAARQLAAVQARQVDLLARALSWAKDAADEPGLLFGETRAQRLESGRRTVVAELAAALHESTRTMSRRLSQAYSIVQRQDTLAALRDGRIGYTHAMILAETCDSLPAGDAVPGGDATENGGATADRSPGSDPAGTGTGTGANADTRAAADARAALETALLPIAATSTPAILGRKARALRERMHPVPIGERSRAARDERRVVFEPDRDGMGWVHHYVPVIDGLRITETLTTMATRTRGRDEHRTIAQLRSDLLTELVLNGSVGDKLRLLGYENTGRGGSGHSGSGTRRVRRSARPRLSMTIPMLTFLGRGDEPATLDGYGPIDPETARSLVAEVPSVGRILTHPVTGVVLGLDRTTYRVPKALRRWLELRDGGCRDPGCNRPAVGGDIDHTIDWDLGGTTRHDNLACLCRASHTKKHRLRWQVRQDEDGVLTWVSPTGRVYVTRPETPMPAHALAPITSSRARSAVSAAAQPSAAAPDRPPF